MAQAGQVIIANHHTAIIALPRAYVEGVALPPVLLNPATTTSIDKAVWDEMRKNKSIEYYLDKKLIAVVKRNTDRLPIEERTVDTEALVPEHLSGSDDEGAEKISDAPTEDGKGGKVKAKVTKKTKGTVKVK